MPAIKKWTRRGGIAALVLVAGLLLLYVIGQKSAHAEIQIPASPQKVWEVLSDFPRTREWNPVLVPIEGTLAEGNSIQYEFYQEAGGPATAMEAQVMRVEESKLIAQKGGMPGLLTFRHQYQLVETAQGTQVIIHETYRGIMVPFWDPRPVEMAYQRLLTSLKQRVIETE